MRQRAGQGAAVKRKMGRELQRAVNMAAEVAAASTVQVVGERAVAAATEAATAAVASAVVAAQLEVKQVAVWAPVLKGDVGMMEEQMSGGIAVAGGAVGGLGPWGGEQTVMRSPEGGRQ